MKKITHIGVLSYAKLQTVMAALIGLILGVLYSVGGFIIDVLVSYGWATSSETPGLSYGTILAFGSLIGMPFIFAICGFILGIIEAILYNLYAKKFGGLGINFE